MRYLYETQRSSVSLHSVGFLASPRRNSAELQAKKRKKKSSLKLQRKCQKANWSREEEADDPEGNSASI